MQVSLKATAEAPNSAYTLIPTSSKSTPHSVAISRIKSEALASAATIKSCPESTKSNIAAWSMDPPKPNLNDNKNYKENK